LNSNDQIILAQFYNSLTSKGSLNWSIEYDLCGQPGVTCDSSNPQSVTQLYFIFTSFFYEKKQISILMITQILNK